MAEIRASRPIDRDMRRQKPDAGESNSILKKRKVDMNIIVDNAMAVASLAEEYGKVDYNDYNAVQIRIDQYIKALKKNGMQPTLVGLSTAMGLDKTALTEIHIGARQVKDKRVKTLIDQMYNVTLMVLEDGMQAGIIKEITGIFLLKNNYGYKDQQEYVVSGGNLLGEARSEGDLLEQYRMSVPEIED